MRDLIWEMLDPILAAVVGYVVASLVRLAKRYRFWRKVETNAKSYLEDDRVPITDPREAAERALIEAQREPVEKVTRFVRESVPPPITVVIEPPTVDERDPGKDGPQ